jgi:hypothetical protein
VTVFGYTKCRCGHPQSVHVIDHKGGRDGCYGLDERPKGKMPAWQDRLCGCPSYRTAWPNTTGTAECVDCGIEFTWRGRDRAFCPKCERRCPHCRAYCRGGTHCDTCGKCRGLLTAEFAQEAPSLSQSQRYRIAQLFSTAEQQFLPGTPHCRNCHREISHPRPALCDDCFVALHGFPRTTTGRVDR